MYTKKQNEVVIVRTGTANLASVLSAFTRLGISARMIDDARQIVRAEKLVLPGVGAFDATMHCLAEAKLVEPLRQRIYEGRSTLAICVGMQVLFETSEEGEEYHDTGNSGGNANEYENTDRNDKQGERGGIGALLGRIERFRGELRVPHLGWNWVRPSDGCRLVQSGYAYFANSYRLQTPPPGWLAASTDYGSPFVAALERGNVLACQFHPELSGAFGLDLIRRWFQNDFKEEVSC